MFSASARLVLVVASGLMTSMAMDGQSLSVTVVTAKSKPKLSAAHIFLKSSKGYMLGNAYQEFGGFYVTDPVIPPEGIKLKPTLIKWETLRSMEFTDWSVREGNSRFVKAKVTLTSGSTREVFVWNPGNDTFYPLSAGEIKIAGKLAVQGAEQDVEAEPGQDLKSLEFETSR